MTAPAGTVHGFLEEFARRLPGPAQVRSEIVAELHDGLLRAVEDNQQAGIEHDEAVELAVRQFGDPRALASAFLPELAAARARQRAAAVLVTIPVVDGIWIVAARSRGVASHGLFDSPAAHLTAALLTLAIVGAGLWTIAATGRATRWLHPSIQLPQLSATAMATALAAVDLAALATLAAPLAAFPGTIHRLAVAAAVLASLTQLVLAGRVARSCLATRREAC
jgi:hypothetical protein